MKVMQFIAAALMAAPRWVSAVDARGIARKRERKRDKKSRVRCLFAQQEVVCLLSFMRQMHRGCLRWWRAHLSLPLSMGLAASGRA